MLFFIQCCYALFSSLAPPSDLRRVMSALALASWSEHLLVVVDRAAGCCTCLSWYGTVSGVFSVPIALIKNGCRGGGVKTESTENRPA